MALSLTACGDDADNDSDRSEPTVTASPAPSPAADDLSGVYDTEVTLAQSTCEGIEVMDNPTSVERDGDTLVLSHAALTFTGTLDPAGAFHTDTQQVEVGPDTHELTVTGSGGEGRLHALVSVEVTGGQSCRYDVAWEGSRR